MLKLTLYKESDMQICTKILLVLSTFITCLAVQVCGAQNDQRVWIIVHAASAEERTALVTEGMCIEEIEDEWVAGIVEADIVEKLARSGFAVLQAIPLEEYMQLLLDSQAMRGNYQFAPFGSMVEKLQILANTHREILTMTSIGRSCEGRDLWMLQFRAANRDSKSNYKPGILFVGNHHAREHMSAEICLSLAAYLCQHKHDKSIANLLNSVDIYIMPVLNPDGVVYDFSKSSFACWRKNRRVNKDRSIGVDLNRNYGYMWTGPGKVDTPSSEQYGGTGPFSEPETQALQAFLQTHKHVKIFISYHSYGKLVLYPWGCKNAPVENLRDRNVYVQLAQKMATITGYKAMQANELYIAPGDANDWAYDAHHIFSFTIELMPQRSSGCGGFYPTHYQAITDDIAKNIQAALYACSICSDPYRLLTT